MFNLIFKQLTCDADILHFINLIGPLIICRVVLLRREGTGKWESFIINRSRVYRLCTHGYFVTTLSAYHLGTA